VTDHPLQSGPQLLRYRPWRGTFLGPWHGVWAIGRSGLALMFRRKLFWALYGLSALIFLFYFFGQYLQVFLEQKLNEEGLRLGGIFTRGMRPEVLLRSLRNALQLNGSADTYGNFLWFEGYIVVVILAFIGSVLVGNDFHHGSLPFYLSKPISRWHYVAGKCLAVGVLINLMTTIPAIVLFLEYGFIDTWDYYVDQSRLLLGVLAYGAVLTVTLSLVLMATSTWLRRTIPMVMIWITIFVLGRLMQRWLVDGLRLSEHWRLMDLWNNIYLTGMWAMGKEHAELRPLSQVQPPYWEAALVVAGIVVACMIYLHHRIKAVEIVS
jgi:ABC-type transport system involved in multi-copper enzyme maturation permease subunit